MSLHPQLHRAVKKNEPSSSTAQFARIIGSYENVHYQHLQSSHLVLDLSVNHDTSYQADVNIHSDDGTNVEYAISDQLLPQPLTLGEGVDTSVSLSYSQLGLHESDFESVTATELYNYLSSQVWHCDLIIIYGNLYQDGSLKGIHDVHMNTPGHDGAIGFYFEESRPHIQWVFIKFNTQRLP